MRIIIAIFLIFLASPAFADPLFTLEITNIKASGTGSPAIPATNRIFRAYPGIEYNIRAGVIGGVYPYTHTLSGEPAGMTINASTGEISWANPQSNSDTITLTVTDSDSPANQAQASWVVTVSTSGFHFINSSYSGTETGSLAQPYSSLNNFLTATYEGTVTDIVYFRAGTYNMVDHNAPNPNVMNISQNPRNWIAYPGESVILQGGSSEGQAQRITPSGPVYFDGLTMRTFVDYGLFFNAAADYITVRRCVFDGLAPSDDVNNNYGFIHTTDTTRSFTVIQDNEFKNWCGSSAIGSIYSDQKILIENNHIHSPSVSCPQLGIGATVGISPKYLIEGITIRGNHIEMGAGVPLSYYLNSQFTEMSGNEICFNFFQQTAESGIVHQWNSHFNQEDTYYWRNTAIGYQNSYRGDGGEDDGPFEWANNVLMHTVNNLATGTYVTYTDNLAGAVNSGIADSDGLLTETYTEHIGTHGWQFADGTTPMDGSYTPPDPDPATGSVTIGGASTITTGGNSSITIGD